MKIVLLTDPNNEESAHDIALHNLRVSDELHHLVYFSQTAMGWMKIHPSKNFQDLEAFLREKELCTHLFCAEPPSDIGADDLVSPNEPGKQCKWMVFFSCRPKEHALAEVLDRCPEGYDENFKRLADAGFVAPKEFRRYYNDDFENDEITPEHLKAYQLINCQRKLLVKDIDNKEFYDITYAELKNKFECDPIKKNVGQLPSGEPLYVLEHQGNIVFPYAFSDSFQFLPLDYCSDTSGNSETPSSSS